MDIEYLSNHRIESFLTCPRKLAFYLENAKELGEVVVGDTAPRTLGTVVHSALELFMGQSDKSLQKLQELYDKVSKEASLSWKSFADGRDMLVSWFTRSADILTKDVLLIEEKFDIKLDGVRLVGVWDRVDKVDSETVDVTDYKSGFVPMSKYEVEHSLQLGIYNLAVRNRYNWVKRVRTVYDFVRWQRVSTEMEDTKLDSLRRYLKVMWDRIHACDRPEARVSGACRWCDYRYKCEVYQSFVKDEKFMIPNIQTDNLTGLLGELELCKTRGDAYETRREEIERWLKDEMTERAINEFEHGGWVVQLNVQRRTTYDYDTVRKIFEPLNLMDRVTSIKKAEVDKLLKEVYLTEDQETQLVASSTASYTQPSLSVKQKRGRKQKSFNGG